MPKSDLQISLDALNILLNDARKNGKHEISIHNSFFDGMNRHEHVVNFALQNNLQLDDSDPNKTTFRW